MHLIHIYRLYFVVPYVGTWIEIPSLARGKEGKFVVPYVGTWIEISPSEPKNTHMRVVPYVGTWIEMYEWVRNLKECLSFPTWERG